MKDIHNHILYGIDDGSESIEESIQLIKSAINGGYTDLILTPHFRKRQGYTCYNEKKREIFNTLINEVKKEKLNINLYLGNEITLDTDLLYYLEVDAVTTLNNSKYLLLELPFDHKMPKLKEHLLEIMDKGYKVIIVHPERYHYYKSMREYEELIQMGVLFQGNFGSLYGKWGKRSKRVLENMLRRHMIHFLGSDIHHGNELTYERLNALISRLEELTGDKKMVRDITDLNIEKVIQNKDIKVYSIIKNDCLIKRIFKKENG